MKIAAVAVAYNEAYQLAAFRAHYSGYARQLYRHIIVDNGSTSEYVTSLRSEFPESEILTRAANGGTTAAFNEGIRCALDDPDVDAILLSVQDVQLDPMFLQSLSSLLCQDPTIAAVGGVVFCAGTQDRVESYGGIVDWDHFVLHPHFNGTCGTRSLPDVLEVDFIPGGVMLVRRDAYERVGLQDERLFMYADELDWTFRAKRSGYRLVVSKLGRAWHQHTTMVEPGLRQRRANFYSSRNCLYLIGKHHGRPAMLRYWATSMLRLVRLFSSRVIHGHFGDGVLVAQFLGLVYGVLGLMGRRLYTKA